MINLIDFVYPNLVENSGNAIYLVGRAILTPKNIDIEAILAIVMDRFPGNINVYLSIILLQNLNLSEGLQWLFVGFKAK